jgi:hypothetical protein
MASKSRDPLGVPWQWRTLRLGGRAILPSGNVLLLECSAHLPIVCERHHQLRRPCNTLANLMSACPPSGMQHGPRSSSSSICKHLKQSASHHRAAYRHGRSARCGSASVAPGISACAELAQHQTPAWAPAAQYSTRTQTVLLLPAHRLAIGVSQGLHLPALCPLGNARRHEQS